jgi:hypothetical protein
VHSIEHKVGRLLELRTTGATTRETLQTLKCRIVEMMREVGASDSFVMVSDLRSARAVPTELAGEVVTLMRLSHARLERAAVLLGDNPAMQLQARRLADEAHFELRRLFTDRADVIAWLEPVLDAAERARLAQFLDGK